MRSFAIIAALGLLVSAVLAVSANYPFDALPLPVQPATSSGEVNRQAYELNGTVKEVQEQLKKMHPGVEFTSKREVHTPRNKDGITCINWADQGLPGATQGALSTTVDARDNMLYSMGCIWVIGSSCVSICCINRENISLCNYNSWSINRAAPYLASYSYDIEWKCIHLFTDPGVYITGGSEGDTDGYAVIILGWNGQGGHSC